MSGLFDSAWLKWSWAVAHGQALEAEITAFDTAATSARQPVITMRTEYRHRRHAFAVVVDSATPLPPEWGLRLGDIASNFRSALDHLAWAIVCRGATPPPLLSPAKQKQVYFPITVTADQFRTALARMLPGARRSDVACVRRFQPFAVGKRNASMNPLAILAKLNNDDKHRRLQPVRSYPTQGAYAIRNAKDCVVTDSRKTAPGAPLQAGSELRTIRVRKTGPNPRLDVAASFASHVTLENLVPVVQWIDNTRDWIGALLRSFGPPP